MVNRSRPVVQPTVASDVKVETLKLCNRHPHGFSLSLLFFPHRTPPGSRAENPHRAELLFFDPTIGARVVCTCRFADLRSPTEFSKAFCIDCAVVASQRLWARACRRSLNRPSLPVSSSSWTVEGLDRLRQRNF